MLGYIQVQVTIQTLNNSVIKNTRGRQSQVWFGSLATLSRVRLFSTLCSAIPRTGLFILLSGDAWSQDGCHISSFHILLQPSSRQEAGVIKAETPTQTLSFNQWRIGGWGCFHRSQHTRLPLTFLWLDLSPTATPRPIPKKENGIFMLVLKLITFLWQEDSPPLSHIATLTKFIC